MATTSLSKLGFLPSSYKKYNNFLVGNAAYNPSSFESIATVTATGGETTLTFNSIPQTYAALQVRLIAERNTTASHNFAVRARLNSATGTNGAWHNLYGDGATVTATNGTSTQDLLTFMPMTTAGTANASLYGAGIIDIINYASSAKNKTIKTFGGFDANGAGRIYFSSGLYALTTAVTSLQFYFDGDALRAGSTFALYGIKG